MLVFISFCMAWFPSAMAAMPQPSGEFEYLDNGMAQLSQDQLSVIDTALFAALRGFLIGNIQHIPYAKLLDDKNEGPVLSKLCTNEVSKLRKKLGNLFDRDTVGNVWTRGREDYGKRTMSADRVKEFVTSFHSVTSHFYAAFKRPIISTVVFDPHTYDPIYGIYSGVAHLELYGIQFAMSVEVGPSVQDLQISGNELAGKLWTLSGIHIPTGLRQSSVLVDSKHRSSLIETGVHRNSTYL